MKRILPFIILTFIVFLYTKPYFRAGFFETHDGEWAIVRLAEMQREVKDGQIPPRWSDYLNHGYGYPLFSYTYPFPFYIGIFFRLIHISYVDSIKIIFVGSVLFSALFMFMLGRELAGEGAGLLASVFYVIAPFRLVDLYVRGSIGESVSLAIFPLLFYLSVRYVLKPSLVNLLLCSFSLAALILSHNIMALVFFPFWLAFLYIMLFSYFEDIKTYTWKYFIPLLILGLGLSAYFFIPALLEKKYLILSGIKLANVSENFINLSDYLFSRWSYGTKPSYQLGWAHIIGALIGLISVIISKGIVRKKYLSFTIYIFISISILVFFTHPSSVNLWRFPPLSWIDFPWRFLTPLAFFLALATIFLSIHRLTQGLGLILVVLTILLSWKYAIPSKYTEKPDSFYTTNDATTTSMDELMPLWVIDKPKNRYQEKVQVEKGTASITNLEYNSNNINFRVVSRSLVSLRINTIYFPGWQFFVSGDKLNVDYTKNDGLIRFQVPPGNHQVQGQFKETSLRFWADVISLMSLVAVLGAIIFLFFTKLKPRFL